MALQDALEGLDLNDLDCYVGVSAGSFLAAALANGVAIGEVHRRFIEEREEGALSPGLFMRPAFGEYLRRARIVPPLLARSAWRYLTSPFSGGALESFAELGRAIPTGVFDNEAIHDYLAATFSRPGQTNDFRQLRRRLYLVATDLDSGETVSFGRPGHDHVPISRAVQASAALPGLFPPVEIGGRHYVDGALRKTLHASEALDAGARLVICVNPIVPFNARMGESSVEPQASLVWGGLPVVLSQTFRAVIHSRMTVGLSKYATQYRGSDVVLFQPDPGDSTIFFTNVFGYAARQQLCAHAYERTLRDLSRRAGELAPVLARHGIRLRRHVLADPRGRPGLDAGRLGPAGGLRTTAQSLRETLRELRLSLS